MRVAKLNIWTAVVAVCKVDVVLWIVGAFPAKILCRKATFFSSET